MSHSDDLKKLIAENSRHLQKLKEQKAKFGFHTPTHILTEIEDREEEIKGLQKALENFIEQEKSAPSIPTHIVASLKPPRSLRVFLCHSSSDKLFVRDLYHKLRNEGFDPWLDEEKLLPGQEWQMEIPKAVRTSDVVIICLSQNSVTKAGYINKEIKYALDVADEQPEGTIFLIPLRLEECQVPDRLSRWQWVNYFDDKGYEKLTRALRVRATDLGYYQQDLAAQIPIPSHSRAPWTDVLGGEVAVRFTPNSYPAVLERVRFYIAPSGKPWTQFAVKIYDVTKDYEPGSPLNKREIYGAGKTGNEWVEIDISSQNIVIQEGDFFVSMVWMTPSGKEGNNAQSLGARENHIIPGKTYYKFGANNGWIQRHDVNCMIQVIVNSGTVLEIP